MLVNAFCFVVVCWVVLFLLLFLVAFFSLLLFKWFTLYIYLCSD